jgi:hypothetical protein
VTSAEAAKHLRVGDGGGEFGTAPAKGLLELTEEIHQMKKFAPFIITAAAMASLAGCAAESGGQAQMTAEDQAATCTNPEGTNAAIAALATAISQEMHRWQLTTDFYEYRGYNYQLMLGITAAGKAACGGDCFFTQNILNMQDSRMDQKVIFDGTRLSSWSFASRLTTGFDNQVTCQRNNQCPFVAHMFGANPTIAPGACDTVFTFPVTSTSGAALTSTQVTQLGNALLWTKGNGPNPYIAFQPTASTVSIDPTGQLNPPGQSTGSDVCQKASRTNINGTPCTCAANNVYSNGGLKNDDPGTPNTYYCRQM